MVDFKNLNDLSRDQNLAIRSYKLGIARGINPFGITNAFIPLLYVQNTALITLRSPA